MQKRDNWGILPLLGPPGVDHSDIIKIYILIKQSPWYNNQEGIQFSLR